LEKNRFPHWVFKTGKIIMGKTINCFHYRALFDFATQRVSFPHVFSGNPPRQALVDARLKHSGMTKSTKQLHSKKAHGSK
jgi:hypothetical protein